ncbi:MAG: glycosyltransferase family 4 protein [Bacteroidales bacterium]|nr:glycosyltransferase family 4 protein [Bacteroidales bacterium]
MKHLSIMELHPFGKWAGPESHVYDLIKGLTLCGHDVCLVARDAEGIDKFEDICPVYKLELRKPHKVDLKYIKYLAGIIKNRRIDIIHTHGGWNSWIAIFATVLAGRGKVVNTWHGLRKVGNDPFHRWFYKKISAIISVSSRLKQDIIASSYINPQKIHVVHNGIDIEKYNIVKFHVHDRYRIPQNNFIVGFLGRIHPEKGLEYLIEAIESLRRKNISTTLLIVGATDDEEYRKQLTKQVEKAGISENIKFCGFAEDVSSYLNAIDVLVSPSICFESFGLVLCEAMACKKPVITTALGAQEEIVEDGVSGFIVPPGDSKAIADKIALLVSDASLCKRMGLNGQSNVQKTFSAEVMGRKTTEVFLKCLSLRTNERKDSLGY